MRAGAGRAGRSSSPISGPGPPPVAVAAVGVAAVGAGEATRAGALTAALPAAGATGAALAAAFGLEAAAGRDATAAVGECFAAVFALTGVPASTAGLDTLAMTLLVIRGAEPYHRDPGKPGHSQLRERAG